MGRDAHPPLNRIAAQAPFRFVRPQPAAESHADRRMMDTSLPRPRPSVRIERLPDGSALLHEPESDAIYAITVTAAVAWDLARDGNSVEEIAVHLAETYDVALPDARRDLAALVDRLAGLGLLEGDGR